MNARYSFLLIPSLLLFLLTGVGWSQDPPPPPQPQGVDVQTRGPVHEAFAEPTTTQPEQSQVVTKQPPDPIEELPPDQKPDGDNVQWIPGYWHWDDEANDFIWVSGCWRDVPPGRRWLAGHWQEVSGGWVWVAGFWATENVDQVQYLPPPPPTVDQGPTAPAPDDNSTYIPGSWVYQTNRYLWRPGFWTPYRLNWVWIPAHYIWTPNGCLFVDGYWDHPLDGRGLLFAPVLINRPVFIAARLPYVPGFVVSPDFLLGAMFVRLSTGHYYFGDYFEPQYAKRGFVPWPDYHPVKGAYAPTFDYYRHLHAADPKWETSLRRIYTGRSGGEIPRPPRTWTKQVEALRTINTNKSANLAVHKELNFTHAQNITAVAPLKEIHNTRVTNLGAIGGVKEAAVARELKVQAIQKEERDRVQKEAAAVREAAKVRHDTDVRMLNQEKIPVQHTDKPNVTKWELPKTTPHAAVPGKTVKPVPPVVVYPKHEERVIPKYEPPHPHEPPKKGGKP
jgi:hypothetical protein